MKDAKTCVFAVWEQVLASDVSPSAMTQSRISDPRIQQFWDESRAVSKNLGETNFKTKVWDWVAVYPKGTRWNERLPKPIWSGRPVEDVVAQFEEKLATAARP